MKRIQLLGVILSFSLLFACKKDSNDSGSNSTKLSKVIVWNTIGYSHTIDVYGYRYDGMNRVSEITYANGDSASGEEQAKPYESIKWFYNGNEQKPFKSSGVNQSFIHYDEYYFYDDMGRLVGDSIVDANSHNEEKYSWGNNMIVRTSIWSNTTGGMSSVNQDTITLSDKSQLGATGSNPQTGESFGSLYTYDNKINPLHLLNIRAAATFTAIAGLPTAGYNENNLIETANGYFDIYGPGPAVFVKSQIISSKYNYNAGGLPVDCETSGNIAGITRYKFYYN
ncbi:hypothetical protein A4H97_15195 [Niastella yeongjuensis]|uniref:DUF4595 domain-containing protein n=1 Tax=Niastella yeongjuensis TaxID=354355 RepID=A0A1V9E4B5_9BACT|nr:hypothetical protein [Niastella yeongjuensis]OQP40948.1 hypothetical protein A4H97_15195 [Niastella yeongjuensis]SEO96947.1 hypothetical protein SAMN05660816_04012 [Niastella yeongjuensis]